MDPRRIAAGAALVALFPGCFGGGGAGPSVSPSGPPSVDPVVAQQHAAQFDDKMSTRPAGSQEEFAAATYILGHLQQAGYTVLLDAVPVEDLVRSTNVVAETPSGHDPKVVITVPYDTGPLGTGNVARDGDAGVAVGTFLELARALNVADPGHPVEFDALGAEHSTLRGGLLGSQSLVDRLEAADAHPLVISLYRVLPEGEGISAYPQEGQAARDAASTLLSLDCKLRPRPRTGTCVHTTEMVRLANDPFVDAGFAHVIVSGSSSSLGPVVLEFLKSFDG